jgi:hypothetical protein
MISYLNDVAYELCDFYDITCCSGQKKKHFSFQCANSVDSKIATILKGGCLEYGLEQGDQYAAFMGAYEIFHFIIEKPETSDMASDEGQCNIPAFRIKRRVELGPLCIHASKS